MVIKWLMFSLISIYSLLDYFQTVALIQCGHTEANPIVIWVIGPDEIWIRFLYCKIFFLLIAGILLNITRKL